MNYYSGGAGTTVTFNDCVFEGSEKSKTKAAVWVDMSRITGLSYLVLNHCTANDNYTTQAATQTNLWGFKADYANKNQLHVTIDGVVRFDGTNYINN